ncbi:MAG: ACT domain-containing protein [Eggerthellaceae bacterium]|jgi:ACT domain-containing protein|nr:ACT domain-containing protein [Eggerthellaceae bacterium]
MRCVISVLGKDKSGIVAAIANALAENDANIIDISQTILDDIFSMTMLISLGGESADFNAVQEALNKVGTELKVQVTVQREDVFHYMYEL